MNKIPWTGILVSIQPRIRLTRSFDQRSHSYLGYCLVLDGLIDNEQREFSVAIGKAVHQKHQFRVGDEISGLSVRVPDARLEATEFYKVSKLQLIKRSEEVIGTSPPFQDVPPELQVYRKRGHRRLAMRTYENQCRSCMWGCLMPVEIIVDHWNPGRKKYRFETFCYGPKSCWKYRAGAKRNVLGRKGMSYTEEDWVDDEAVSHRGEDE